MVVGRTFQVRRLPVTSAPPAAPRTKGTRSSVRTAATDCDNSTTSYKSATTEATVCSLVELSCCGGGDLYRRAVLGPAPSPPNGPQFPAARRSPAPSGPRSPDPPLPSQPT